MEHIGLPVTSGNIVLRNDNKISKQDFHMLYETGAAVDIAASQDDGTHEDQDMGSWSLFVQDKDLTTGKGVGLNWQLGIDPPYFGWDNARKARETNGFSMHNTVQLPGTGSYHSPQLNIIKANSDPDQEYELKIDYGFFNEAITRNVMVVNQDDILYYFMNDYTKFTTPRDTNQTAQIHISGNGNGLIDEGGINAGKKTYRMAGNLHQWTYPCKSDSGNWKLTVHVTALNESSPSMSLLKLPWTNDAYTVTGTKGQGISEGTHTQLIVEQKTGQTIFQSFIYPQKCRDSLPVVLGYGDTGRVSTVIRFISRVDTISRPLGKNNYVDPSTLVVDTISHVHYTRLNGGVADTVVNPFNLPNQTNRKLKLNAEKAFIKNNTMELVNKGYKYCPPSYLHVRSFNFKNGSYIILEDTLVLSTSRVNTSFSFVGRHWYRCSVKPLQTVSSTDTIIFYLPDVGKAVDMVALVEGTADTLPGRYDSLTNKFHLLIPESQKNFTFEEKQQCLDCFFPPVSSPYVDTVFSADDGSRHTLGHKLTIRPNNGTMYVSNSTKISMCDGAYIWNQDSLILDGPCQTKKFKLLTCHGIDSLSAFSDNSSITISAGSALILDSGSHTIVKNGAGIYVKALGSLVIKNDAFVQIGDSGTCNMGWGEIIAEPNAFIFIDPAAHIEFRRVIRDTSDRNLFVVALYPTAAITGVYYPMLTTLQNDLVFPDTFYAADPIDICDLDSLYPIANREWGYCNFARALATFQARNDTLCPGESLTIKLSRILNDARYEITVCRIDSNLVFNKPTNMWVWKLDCVEDSVFHDTVPNDPPTCREPRNTPDDWTYYFAPRTLHKITIKVWNGCDEYHDTTAYIYVADTPRFTISIPDSACEGIGGVIAVLTDTINQPVYYAWEVEEIPDTANQTITSINKSETYREDFYGLLPDTFDFPNYYFKGGRSYLVALSVTNSCATYYVYDTVCIPSGVSITLERLKAYAQPINGATSIQLVGHANLYDSVRWVPDTYLDDDVILTPISTPLDSISYIFIAFSGQCLSMDTVHIKYNRYANAGYNDTLCYDTNTISTERLLGFPYDMSLLVGILYYYNPTGFMTYYNNYNTLNDPQYFRYFTHFMHYWSFQSYASSCPIDLYNFFTNTVDKELFFKGDWYKAYYQSFASFGNVAVPALADFKDTVDNNSTLSNHLNSLYNWGGYDGCMDNIFIMYDDFVTAHSSEITASWIRITDQDTTIINGPGGSNNYFIVSDAPPKSSTYVLSVITPSTAEIDEITIVLDTALSPAFAPVMQFDSTVYFMNFTTPVSSITSYEWNFGDGTLHSSDATPFHTFLGFDTSFVVCLSASNLCGTWMFCDTVWIDSAHWGGSLFTEKTPPDNSVGRGNSHTELRPQMQKLSSNGENPIALTNYPNPFGNSTIIHYEIWQPYSNAELRITTMLGQQVFNQKLLKPMDKIQIDGSALQDGLYYYSIIVDGSVKQTKSMAVMH